MLKEIRLGGSKYEVHAKFLTVTVVLAFFIQFAITPYVGAAQETQDEILQASITKDEFEEVEEVVRDNYELLVEDINEDILLNYDENDKVRAL